MKNHTKISALVFANNTTNFLKNLKMLWKFREWYEPIKLKYLENCNEFITNWGRRFRYLHISGNYSLIATLLASIGRYCNHERVSNLKPLIIKWSSCCIIKFTTFWLCWNVTPSNLSTKRLSVTYKLKEKI